MSPEFQKIMFDPFSPAQMTIGQPEFRGTGLGMAISRNIVNPDEW